VVDAAASVIVEEVVYEEARMMLVDFLPLLRNSLRQDETIRMLQEAQQIAVANLDRQIQGWTPRVRARTHTLTHSHSRILSR